MKAMPTAMPSPSARKIWRERGIFFCFIYALLCLVNCCAGPFGGKTARNGRKLIQYIKKTGTAQPSFATEYPFPLLRNLISISVYFVRKAEGIDTIPAWMAEMEKRTWHLHWAAWEKRRIRARTLTACKRAVSYTHLPPG